MNEYSNVGSGLLGFTVERLAGRDFAELAREKVFLPLGMNESSFRLAALDESHVAMPYESEEGRFEPVGHTGFPTYPDGLLRTSVPQLARFLAMVMNGGELDGRRVLKAETVAEMTRVQIPELDAAQGLVWFHEEIGGRRVIGHDGEDDGTTSFMYFDPEAKVGVLLVANGIWDEDAALDLMDRLFEEGARD